MAIEFEAVSHIGHQGVRQRLGFEVVVSGSAVLVLTALRRRSPAADQALTDLRTAYGQVQADTDIQKTFLATSFGNLDKIGQARTARILQARTDDGPPWPLWAVIFITSAMVLGTAIIYGVERPVLHYPMVAIVGVLVATNLFLVLELAHPFIGDIATTPDPLREVVRVLTDRSG